VSVSDRDRRRFAAQARDLATLERDDAADDRSLRRAIEVTNRVREIAGIALIDEKAEPPELEFYRRARALGFRRIGG
jgi:hypothetical protein